MSDSSDEEKLNPDSKDGKVSPQTLLAIQQALTEDEVSVSLSKLQTSPQRPARRVVISSSNEEMKPSLKEESDFSQSATCQSSHIKDSFLGSSSEDDLEEVIGAKNKAFRSAALRQSPTTAMESEVERVREGEKQKELEPREPEHKLHASQSNQELSISSPSLPSGKQASAETEQRLLDKSKRRLTADLAKADGDDVKSGNSQQESDSEGKVTIIYRLNCLFYHPNLKWLCFTESFIEVSEEEFKQEDANDSAGEKRILEEVQEDETKTEEESEENLTQVVDHPALSSDKEDEEEGEQRKAQGKEVKDDMESKPTAENEWEHLDMVSISPSNQKLFVSCCNKLKQFFIFFYLG